MGPGGTEEGEECSGMELVRRREAEARSTRDSRLGGMGEDGAVIEGEVPVASEGDQETCPRLPWRRWTRRSG